jgi:hypothetical protein
LLLGYLEKLLEERHRIHALGLAANYLRAQASLYRILAWALGITILFGLYFALVEITGRLGTGELWVLFFESPKSGGRSSQPAVPAGNPEN